MKYVQKDEILIQKLAIREELIERVEVLDKVKQLFMSPRLDFVTIQAVADYYEVPVNTVRNSVILLHREELEKDGMINVTRKEVLARMTNFQSDVITHRGGIEVEVEGGNNLKFSNGKTLVLPKRAVLRVGMLLRDSYVAREVRTQLLNIYEETERKAPELITKNIHSEIELIEKTIWTAFTNNMEKLLEEIKDINSHDNRYTEEAYKALEQENLELKESITELNDLVEHLRLTNKVLSDEIDVVTSVETYRRVIISMMIRIAERKQFRSPYLCYKELYTVLRNEHEIDLAGRRYALSQEDQKLKSKIDCIETIEEWKIALKISTAMCYKHDVTIDDLLKQLETIEDDNAEEKAEEIQPF